MIRETYVIRNGELIPKHLAPPLRPAARSHLPTPMIAGDYAGYECPVSGRWIEGRAAHRENLARTGCRLLEPGESAEAMRTAGTGGDAAIEAAVDRAVNEVAKDLLV
ncbi:hypothetical protein [Azospirillum sp. sgz302134]